MRFLDTNVILRYLTNDLPKKADACEHLFKEVSAGRGVLYTSSLVLAETIWVLESGYKFPKKAIAECIKKILNTPNLEVENKSLVMGAVALYEIKDIDYIDAYNVVLMEKERIREIYSYDKDFDSVSTVVRLEP